MERIYEIQHGGDRSKSSNGTFGANQFAPSANGTSSKMTQQELADKLGIGLDTLKRAKSLTNLSPEIQQLIEQGSISASTAARLVAKLSPKQAKNRQRQIHTVIKSVTPTEYNNSNKEIRCYTLIQILVFR